MRLCYVIQKEGCGLLVTSHEVELRNTPEAWLPGQLFGSRLLHVFFDQ